MFRRCSISLAVLALVAVAGAPAAIAGRGPSSPPGQSATYQTKVFARGAPIHGANGLAVDADGRLLVASVFGGELVALDTRTGQITERFGHADGVDAPDDVAIGPDGSLYWTDIVVGEVGRLTPSGTVTKQFVAPGVNPLAFTEDGRLFVGQAFFGDGLYEVDPELALSPRVVIPDSATPPYITQLNGFDFGPDGMLYAPQPFLARIVRIDPDTSTGDMEVVTDTLPGNPTSVEFDPAGELYASMVQGAVVRIDPDTGTHQLVIEIGDAVFDNMTFDAGGRLFVSDSDDGAIYAVAPGGGVRTLSRGGLVLPGGITVMENDAGDESLYVADVWSLARLSVRSGRVVDLDSQSRAGGGIIESWTVAPDGGNVIITSFMSSAVQIWDPEADAVVAMYPNANVPLNALRFQGELVVAELLTGRLVIEDGSGTPPVLAGGFQVPAGLAATDDDLWVADWASGVVWQVVADGVTLSSPQPIAGDLQFPEGMAVDRDGSLLVVEAGAGRLVRIDPATGEVTTVADGFAFGVQGSRNMPPTFALSSVTVSESGAIFVTADVDNVVYRLHPLPAR